MATVTLTMNPELVTVPANTDEHQINFDGLMADRHGSVFIKRVSGTSVQINASGIAITSATGALDSTVTEMLLPAKKGVPLRMKGGAGSETFMVSIWYD